MAQWVFISQVLNDFGAIIYVSRFLLADKDLPKNMLQVGFGLFLVRVW
jgi:hypothetical protein